MPTFYDLQKFAHTGIASTDMTAYDKMRALAAFGGGKTQTLTGVPPLSFKANGKPLISWSMLGNGSQIGTPTPDAPIMPDFCGTLSGSDWTIPITCAGQTTPVYLGQTQTVRKIRKLVLTGEENWIKDSDTGISARYYISISDIESSTTNLLSTNFSQSVYYEIGTMRGYRKTIIFSVDKTQYPTIADFTAWLATQYAASTPVVVWYVLDNEQTGIVNEPLAKIGDYADELHSADAAATIPTDKGANTLTVDTPIQPSEMTITYKS